MNVRRHDERTALSIAAPVRQDMRQRQTTVLWIIAILLAVIATAVLTRSSDSFGLPKAHGDAPMAGARGIFAFTGQIDRNRFGLFMMDVDSSNVWCYEYLPGTRKLKLVAARSFLYDRYLDEYETEEPSPKTVKGMLEKQRQAINRNGGYAAVGDDEDAGTAIDTNEPVNTVAPISAPEQDEETADALSPHTTPMNEPVQAAVTTPAPVRTTPPPPAPPPAVTPPPPATTVSSGGTSPTVEPLELKEVELKK